MYNIIYKDNHFLGYTTDKKLLKNFLKNRKGKYSIQKLKESEIPDEIKKSPNFDLYNLTTYTNYYTDNNTVLFYYEYMDMESLMIEDALALQFLLKGIIEELKYFKFDDTELKLIQYSFNKIIDDLYSITDSNEIIFDEIINIHKYFYERYLPHRKGTKDIIENSFVQDY